MADLNVQLLDWQQDVYSDPTRFKVVAAGRRTGEVASGSMDVDYQRPSSRQRPCLLCSPDSGAGP